VRGVGSLPAVADDLLEAVQLAELDRIPVFLRR
jgi:hypothetical protein